MIEYIEKGRVWTEQGDPALKTWIKARVQRRRGSDERKAGGFWCGDVVPAEDIADLRGIALIRGSVVEVCASSAPATWTELPDLP